jgi:DNA polymerase-3 subunit delta'
MSDDSPVADAIEGIPVPAESSQLIGHEANVLEFLAHYKTGKLHHAHFLTGPKGIGKSTFAMHMARHILSNPESKSAPDELRPQDLSNPVDAQIASRAHPNLLHLQRPWDTSTKKFKTKLTVDEVRRTVPFFGNSRGDSGWRVAIVDSIDDMNANAANALLKVLEEPPERTVFFVLAHSVAKVLPTIRSRCQHTPMKPLSADQLVGALKYLDVAQETSTNDQELLAKLSCGSVRDAITLSNEGGLELYRSFEMICKNLSNPDFGTIHSLAEKVASRAAGGNDRYKILLDFAERYMEARATGKTGDVKSVSMLARWAEVWEKTRNSVRAADAYNLDRKQVILNLFQDMGEVARAG